MQNDPDGIDRPTAPDRRSTAGRTSAPGAATPATAPAPGDGRERLVRAGWLTIDELELPKVFAGATTAAVARGLLEAPVPDLTWHSVSTEVSTATTEGPQLIAPVAPGT